MKSKLQKIILYLFLLCCIYSLWTLRPVQILYTYSDAGNSVFLVVDHLPWTDSDKINWYLKHQNEIKNQHPLPEGSWHTWYVIDIGNGFTDYKKYIEGPYEDLYCFPTIKSNDNCIVKNYLMVINEYPYRNTHFFIADNNEYQLTQENKIERVFNPHDFEKDNFQQ